MNATGQGEVTCGAHERATNFTLLGGLNVWMLDAVDANEGDRRRSSEGRLTAGRDHGLGDAFGTIPCATAFKGAGGAERRAATLARVESEDIRMLRAGRVFGKNGRRNSLKHRSGKPGEQDFELSAVDRATHRIRAVRHECAHALGTKHLHTDQRLEIEAKR